jgi:hypothetical protein
MTDEVYTLNTTNKDRARTARGAHNKVTHSGCKLPSDYLTAAEKKKLNGPVTSIKTNAPMTWETYKTLPDSSRRFYIEGLRQKYSARDAWIAEMFGIADCTMTHERERLGIPGYPKGGRAKMMDVLAWKTFLGEKAEDETVAETQAVEETVPSVTLESVSWADLFAVAKLLGERYGVRVRVEVDT